MGEKFEKLISDYINLIKKDNNKGEVYKWEAIMHFQSHWNINSDDFYLMFKNSLKKRENLIYLNSFGFLNKLGQNYPDDLKSLFVILYDENIPLKDRYIEYKNKAAKYLEKLKIKIGSTKIKHQQDERTISFLLTLRYPNKYFFYKNNVYNKYCDYLNLEKKETGEKFFHFVDLCDDVLNLIKTNSLLQIESSKFIPDNYKFNSEKLLFQDILYRVLIRKPNMEKVADFFNQLMYDVKNRFGEENHPLYNHVWETDTENISFRQISVFPHNKKIPMWKFHYEVMLHSNNLTVELHPEGNKEFKDEVIDLIEVSNQNFKLSKWKCGIKDKNISNSKYYKIVSKAKISIDDFDNNFDNISDKLFVEIKKIYDSYNDKIIEFFNYVNMKLKENFLLLKTNKNLIFTGAPGTGKTYLAKQIANEIILSNQIITDDLIIKKFVNENMVLSTKEGYKFTILKIRNDKINIKPNKGENEIVVSYDEIIDCLKNDCFKQKIMEISNKGNGSYIVGIAKHIFNQHNNLYIDFVQFHPSYDYTDFVEGLRPIKKDNKELGFELKNGTFKAFCKKAKDDPDNDYVFIIDEINRAEISKVFGELFYSIEPDYRGVEGKVKTQYENIQEGETVFDNSIGKGWFYIPENVYIIGTMNDIDRSVESFDFAMRRRFAWKEITATERIDMWNGNIDKYKDEANKRMHELNKAIENLDGFNSSYHIGPAYFLKLKLYKNDDNPFKQLWDNHIVVLLQEYLRGIQDAKSQLEVLEKAYYLENKAE